MSTTTKPKSLSITSQIIEQQIRQLQYTGLFLALTGNIGEELHRIRVFHDVIKIGLKVARTYGVETTPKEMPVIYNPSNWTSDQLCGYAGRDLEITADELITSYLESWFTELRLPQVSLAHFLKCALWYSERHGRDPLVGLSFLFDLFDRGFFVNLTIFGDALNSYVRFHALGIDWSFMEQTTIADVALINENLTRITREYKEVQLDLERFEALIAAVGDLTMDWIQRARQAESLDEWLIREASVSGPVWWLAIMHHASSKMDLGILTRQMLSQIEEIGADLQASMGWRSTQAEFQLPPVWGINRFTDIAKGYLERYPDDSWLNHMTNDRLLFPDSVRELIRPAGIAGFTSSTLTPKWRFPSEKLAFPLCLAHGRHPSFVRSADFSLELIDEAIRELGLPLDRGESMIAARRRLLELTEAALDAETQMSGTRWADELRIHELRALYPWHPTLCRYDGVLRGMRGDSDGALLAFQNCLLIEPDGVAHWLAVAKLAQLRGSGDDAAALSEIAHRVANLHGAYQ